MPRQIFKSKLLTTTYILLISLLLSTCKKEPLILKVYPNVPKKLCLYFQIFEQEASMRGIEVDLSKSNISVRLANINGAIGLCNMHEKKEIIIDQNFWDRSNHWKRELIVFHELGHCFLNRKHNNELMDNGTCASIMRSGRDGCIDFYTEQTREILLDELFL